MPTEGMARPRSICEIRLGETLSRRANSRSEMPSASRPLRTRAPNVSRPSCPGAALAGIEMERRGRSARSFKRLLSGLLCSLLAGNGIVDKA